MLGTKTRFLNFLGLNPTGDVGPFTIYTSKRRKTVIYPRAPPTSPPTPRQKFQRDAFYFCARIWSTLTPGRRTQWNQLAIQNHLKITGYNLFTYYMITHDANAIRTLKPDWGPPY